MKQSEKLKVLIDSIKTANELMRKQIEINGRAVELLGEFITEPETLGKTPLISTLTRVAEELKSEVKGEYQEIPIGVVGKDGKIEPYIKPDAMYKDIYLLGGVPKDDKAPAYTQPSFKAHYDRVIADGGIIPFIKPKDMKAGEWYVTNDGWLFKFHKMNDKKHFKINPSCKMDILQYWYGTEVLGSIDDQYTYRKATQEEILKYFPNELEVPTHGGNDAAYIQEVTDTQL